MGVGCATRNQLESALWATTVASVGTVSFYDCATAPALHCSPYDGAGSGDETLGLRKVKLWERLARSRVVTSGRRNAGIRRSIW